MPKSTLISVATGLGKTVVMAEVAKRWRYGRVLLLAHREELIFQGANSLSCLMGEEVAIEMADNRSNETPGQQSRVVVASVMTMIRRLEKFSPFDFGLLLTDEAHHATAASYRKIYRYFGQNPNLCHLGVTATPDRADEEALGQVYDSVAFEYGILDGINDGWLVPVEQQFVSVDGLDLSGCSADKHDLKDSDVARIMENETLQHKIAHPTIELVGDRPTLVFTASVDHANKTAEIFNRHRSGCAAAINGKTNKDVRREAVKAFCDGTIQYLVGVGVFTEGFDAPNCSAVAMGRPTKSRSLYAQCIGRSTRPLPGTVDGDVEDRHAAIASSGKPNSLILDFVGNSGRHKLVCTADILGGKESDEVVDRARNNASKKGRPVNMAEELEEAREQLIEELRKKRAAEEASRAALVARAKYKTMKVSPFDVFDLLPRREPGWHKGRSPTEGQVAALRKFKVSDSEIRDLSFSKASQLLDTLVTRSKSDLCSYKQAKLLSSYGLKTDVSFQEASQVIDRLKRNGWKL
jgi:superfamily II DNA or RNA helicase